RLARPDERTHELAVSGGYVDVRPGAAKEIAGVLGAIDAGRLEVDRVEAGFLELAAILALLERTSYTPDPKLHAPADLGRHLAAHHNIGHRKASARTEDAERFREDAVLVGGQIDDAVRDDDVHRVVRKGNGFDLA